MVLLKGGYNAAVSGEVKGSISFYSINFGSDFQNLQIGLKFDMNDPITFQIELTFEVIQGPRSTRGQIYRIFLRLGLNLTGIILITLILNRLNLLSRSSKVKGQLF